jgi:hypothetical protein
METLGLSLAERRAKENSIAFKKDFVIWRRSCRHISFESTSQLLPTSIVSFALMRRSAAGSTPFSPADTVNTYQGVAFLRSEGGMKENEKIYF